MHSLSVALESGAQTVHSSLTNEFCCGEQTLRRITIISVKAEDMMCLMLYNGIAQHMSIVTKLHL